MPNYSKYFGPGEHEAGTTYPSGLVGKKGARGYLGAAGQWSPTPVGGGGHNVGNQGAMAGLQGAAPNNDPLGLGPQTRGMQHALYASMNGERGVGGPLPDPQWEGFYQSLAEHGVTRLGDNKYQPGGSDMLSPSPGNAPPPISPLDNYTAAEGGQDISGNQVDPVRALKALKLRQGM